MTTDIIYTRSQHGWGCGMNAIETLNIGPLTVSIYQDVEPESPREWGPAGNMVCWHGRYRLGDDHEYSDPVEFRAHIDTDPGAKSKSGTITKNK